MSHNGNFYFAFSDFVHLFLNRTNFDYLQEVPILTLDVNEDFKDKHSRLVEKVDLYKGYRIIFVLFCVKYSNLW